MAKLPADIQYLLDDKIGLVLSEGLDVLYRIQPRHPIDYLAKWLLNHEATQHGKKTVHQADDRAKEIIKKYDDLAEQKRKEEAKLEEQRQATEKTENQFREKLRNHDYHFDLLKNDFPAFVERQTKLPAIYIGHLEHPSRPPAEEDEEELAHLDTSRPKLITYIGAAGGSSSAVLYKELQPETGVTYDVLKPKEEEEQPPAGEDGEEVIVETKPNYLYIPDVTKEPRIVYFRIPKLGAFLACPLAYRSVLSEKAFEEGCQERRRVRAEKEAQKKEKEEKDQEYQARIQEAQEQGQDTEEIEAEWKAIEWPEIKEKDFEEEEVKFVLCVDTLGEDREITEDERNYVSEIAQTFVTSWEESEKRQLSRDIDLYLEAQDQFNREEFLENLKAKLAEEVDKYQEEEGDSELKQNYKKSALAAECYRSKLTDDDVVKQVKLLTNLRVVKYKLLIQNIMYFLGYKKGQVNEPGKNLLDWREIKKILAKDEFFKKLEDYEFRGSKEGYWERYALVNRLLQKLEKFNIEEIEEYNVGLGVLYRFVKQVLEARQLDIQVRRTQKEEERKTREDLIVEAENLKVQFETDLAEAQARAQQDEEEFNQEEWEKTWHEEHPAKEIPPEVEDDVDEDLEEVVAE